MNPTEQTLTPKARSTMGTFMGADVDQVDDSRQGTDDSEVRVSERSKGSKEVLRHLQPLYDASKENFRGPKESRRFAALLTQYSALFSTGDGDVEQVAFVEHSISLIEGARPVRLPPH